MRTIAPSMNVFLLAGGKSSRMGTDKGLLKIKGQCMIEFGLFELSRLSQKMSICTDNSEYLKFGYPLIEDIYKECGPLGGIHSALVNSDTEYNIFLNCDSPFIKAELFELLMASYENNEAIIPVFNGKTYPLSGIYSRSCLPEIESALSSGNFKVKELLTKVKCEYVPIKEYSAVHSGFKNIFLNVNTPADFKICLDEN